MTSVLRLEQDEWENDEEERAHNHQGALQAMSDRMHGAASYGVSGAARLGRAAVGRQQVCDRDCGAMDCETTGHLCCVT